MPVVNQAQREITYKIVYYGTGLGGKTTNLRYIYNHVAPEHRNEMVSLATPTERTLFFDFLALNVPTQNDYRVKVSLYTVPGQEEYHRSRKMILQGVDGIVFVADSAWTRAEENVHSLNELKTYLTSYKVSLSQIPYVLQYNKRDLDNIIPFDEMDRMLNSDNVPAFEAIAVTGMQVFGTLKTITRLVISPKARV